MDYIFETEHLRLRCFHISDVKKLYENHLELELKQWIPNESFEDISEAEDAINFYMDCVNRRQLPYVLAIEAKESGELIGDTGVNKVEGSESEVEIGFSICKQYSGYGYATEALIGMTNYIEGTFGVKTLYGRVMKGNVASSRVMEKAGYQFIQEEFGAEDDPYGYGMLIYKKEL